MDDLFNLLVQRGLQQQQPPAPQQDASLPQVPPNPKTKVPQEVKRFSNAQQIQGAYANGWTPNPVILRAMLGHR